MAEYQKIPFNNIADFEKGMVILGTIVSIDPFNNCAEITLNRDYGLGVDLDAVPFFYHCENASGTVEELAEGYKAFREGELVTCLFAPGDDGYQLYIDGHPNKRGTERCEYIEVFKVTLSIGHKENFGDDFTHVDWVFLFNPQTKAILAAEDITTPEYIKAEDEAAYSFPAFPNSNIDDWIDTYAISGPAYFDTYITNPVVSSSVACVTANFDAWQIVADGNSAVATRTAIGEVGEDIYFEGEYLTTNPSRYEYIGERSVEGVYLDSGYWHPTVFSRNTTEIYTGYGDHVYTRCTSGLDQITIEFECEYQRTYNDEATETSFFVENIISNSLSVVNCASSGDESYSYTTAYSISEPGTLDYFSVTGERCSFCNRISNSLGSHLQIIGRAISHETGVNYAILHTYAIGYKNSIDITASLTTFSVTLQSIGGGTTITEEQAAEILVQSDTAWLNSDITQTYTQENRHKAMFIAAVAHIDETILKADGETIDAKKVFDNADSELSENLCVAAKQMLETIYSENYDGFYNFWFNDFTVRFEYFRTPITEGT